MLREHIDKLADAVGKHAEVGLLELFQPWLGQQAVSLLEPSILDVGETVSRAFREALAAKLAPEFLRLVTASQRCGQDSASIMLSVADASQTTPKASPAVAPATPDNVNSSGSPIPGSTPDAVSRIGTIQSGPGSPDGMGTLLPHSIFEEMESMMQQQQQLQGQGASGDAGSMLQPGSARAGPLVSRSDSLQESRSDRIHESASGGSCSSGSGQSPAQGSMMTPQQQQQQQQQQANQRRSIGAFEMQQQQQQQQQRMQINAAINDAACYQRRSLGAFDQGPDQSPLAQQRGSMNLPPSGLPNANSGPCLDFFPPELNTKPYRRFSCDVPPQGFAAFRGLTVSSPQHGQGQGQGMGQGQVSLADLSRAGASGSGGGGGEPGQQENSAAAAMAAAVQQHLQQQLMQSASASAPQGPFSLGGLLNLAVSQQQQQQQPGSFPMPSEQDLINMLQQSMGSGPQQQPPDLGNLLGAAVGSPVPGPGYHMRRPLSVGIGAPQQQQQQCQMSNLNSMANAFRSMPATPAGMRQAYDMFQPGGPQPGTPGSGGPQGPADTGTGTPGRGGSDAGHGGLVGRSSGSIGGAAGHPGLLSAALQQHDQQDLMAAMQEQAARAARTRHESMCMHNQYGDQGPFATAMEQPGSARFDRRNIPSINDLLLMSPATIMEHQAAEDMAAASAGGAGSGSNLGGTPTRQELDFLRQSMSMNAASSPGSGAFGDGMQPHQAALLRSTSAAAVAAAAAYAGNAAAAAAAAQAAAVGRGVSFAGCVGEPPARFKVLPEPVQARIMGLTTSNPVITVKDFDEKVVNKMSILVDMYGPDEALTMMAHLEHRMRTKQGVMKNGPGYLDVAVSSHLDMLKAQGSCPKSMTTEEYAAHALSPPVLHELKEAVHNNKWLEWDHLDQGIIQLIKKLPRDSAVEKLQEISYHSFKNVDNIKGCIMSILNSKIREDRRKQ